MPTPAYLTLKALHILAAVLFLGNIIIGAFWKAHADRTGDPRLIAFTMDGIIRADRWFTMPGVTLLVLAGFGAAGMGRLPMRSAWIVWGIVLLVISGVAFMARLVPLQRRMRDLARGAASGEPSAFDHAAYARLSRQWAIWGGVATLAPVVALGLMVLKPA